MGVENCTDGQLELRVRRASSRQWQASYLGVLAGDEPVALVLALNHTCIRHRPFVLRPVTVVSPGLSDQHTAAEVHSHCCEKCLEGEFSRNCLV